MFGSGSGPVWPWTKPTEHEPMGQSKVQRILWTKPKVQVTALKISVWSGPTQTVTSLIVTARYPSDLDRKMEPWDVLLRSQHLNFPQNFDCEATIRTIKTQITSRIGQSCLPIFQRFQVLDFLPPFPGNLHCNMVLPLLTSLAQDPVSSNALKCLAKVQLPLYNVIHHLHGLSSISMVLSFRYHSSVVQCAGTHCIIWEPMWKSWFVATILSFLQCSCHTHFLLKYWTKWRFTTRHFCKLKLLRWWLWLVRKSWHMDSEWPTNQSHEHQRLWGNYFFQLATLSCPSTLCFHTNFPFRVISVTNFFLFLFLSVCIFMALRTLLPCCAADCLIWCLSTRHFHTSNSFFRFRVISAADFFFSSFSSFSFSLHIYSSYPFLQCISKTLWAPFVESCGYGRHTVLYYIDNQFQIVPSCAKYLLQENIILNGVSFTVVCIILWTLGFFSTHHVTHQLSQTSTIINNQTIMASPPRCALSINAISSSFKYESRPVQCQKEFLTSPNSW